MNTIRKEAFKIEGIPALLFGEATDRLYLFIHGQGGCKEEALHFAIVAAKNGWQTLSIDLPEHGERHLQQNAFDPWHVVPELITVMKYTRSRWPMIALRANSIGAWFCLLAYGEESLERCLLVSPLTDMKKLIENMMLWAGVSEKQLECEGSIFTSFGQTLSWDYFTYAKEHPIITWNVPTEILYGETDHLIAYPDIVQFADTFHCHLSVLENGEHWFHTPDQLQVLQNWTLELFEQEN